MSNNELNRRVFLQQGLAVGVAGLGLSRITASSYARAIGANERINVGLIGCGGRGQYIIKNMAKPSDPNFSLVAISDIWKSRLEEYANAAAGMFDAKPKAHADYRKVLEDLGVDAVIIATPDHQHSALATEAVLAGKHVYIEKPIIGLACDIGDLNKCYDTVKASKMVVQHGTQGVSCPAARALKQFIADRKLGKLFRIESTETLYKPYWVNYPGPKAEADTDWKAFLFNRKDRPFDAHMHACWMGYKDITSGTIGGWMSHILNTVHYVTGCDFPVSAAAWGGHYAPTNDPRCDAPDQTMVVMDYAEGFHLQFTSHFGSDIQNESTIFMFEKGCVRTHFGHHLGNPVVSGEGTGSDLKPYKLLEQDPPYPGAAHVKNWFDCIRSGEQPNANMDYGYKHGIAVIMGDVAWNTGCKARFDKQKREVK